MTVDNYQGEESDLIIWSFVCRNEGGQMGFIGDANRLNVAISRARCVRWPLFTCMYAVAAFSFQLNSLRYFTLSSLGD